MTVPAVIVPEPLRLQYLILVSLKEAEAGASPAVKVKKFTVLRYRKAMSSI